MAPAHRLVFLLSVQIAIPELSPAYAAGPTDPTDDPTLWGYQSGPWEDDAAAAAASGSGSTVLHSVSNLPNRDGSFEVLLAGQQRREGDDSENEGSSSPSSSSCFLQILDGETGLAGGGFRTTALSDLPWVGRDPRGGSGVTYPSSRCTSAGPAMKGEGKGAFAYIGYGERGAATAATPSSSAFISTSSGNDQTNPEEEAKVVPFLVYVPAEDDNNDSDGGGAVDFDLPAILREKGLGGGAHYPVAFDAFPLGAAGQQVPSGVDEALGSSSSEILMDVVLVLASSLTDRSSSSGSDILYASDPAASPSPSPAHPMRTYPYGSNFAVTALRLQLFRSEDGSSFETNVAWGPNVHRTDQAVAASASASASASNHRRNCPGCSAYAVDVKLVRHTRTEGADAYDAIIGGSTDGTGAFFGYQPLSKDDDVPTATTSVNGFVVRLDATADGSFNPCAGNGCYENPDATRIVSANSDDHEEVSGLCVIDDDERGSGGAVFVVGSTDGAMASETRGAMDIYINKLRLSTLVSMWKRQVGSKHDDFGGGCALTRDSERVHVVGTVGGKISNKKKSRGRADVLLASFDALTSASIDRFPQMIGSVEDDVDHGVILGGGGVTASPRNGDAIVAGVTRSNLYAPKGYEHSSPPLQRTSAFALSVGRDSGNWLQPNEELFTYSPGDSQETSSEGDQASASPQETSSEEEDQELADSQESNSGGGDQESASHQETNSMGETSNGCKRSLGMVALAAIMCGLTIKQP